MIINFKQLGQSGGGQGGGISSGDVQTIIESYITTAITSTSTDEEIPSAKAVYDELGNIETLLSQI